MPLTLDPFRLSEPETMHRLFSQAGFQDIKIEQLPIVYSFHSAAEYLDFAYDTNGTFKKRIATLAQSERTH